jgi:hypothetical protein
MKYHYSITSGVRRVKTKLDLGKSLLGFVALAFPGVLALSTLGAAAASPPSFGLQPFVYDPGNDCPGIQATWTNSTGNLSPSILLTKPCPIVTNAASGVDIIAPSVEGQPVSNLTELNFDYKTGEHCGGGAPRFNVVVDGSTYFLGCNGGVQTPNATTGWTHVEYGATQFAAAGIPLTGTLDDVYIIFDEGFDTPAGGTIGTPGTVHIDNVSVNNQVVGSPTSASSKDDCKNGGWQNLLDSNGQAFKNQGQCVSSSNHNNGVGKDDVKVHKL